MLRFNLTKKINLRGIILLAVLGHLWLLLHLDFTAWPEMLAYPYLINHGYRFYGDIIHPFMPLLPYGLAAIMRFFGSYIIILKGITWIIILLTDLLLWLIVKKLFGEREALISLIVYIFWQVFFEGNGLWFDLAITPILLCSFYFACIWLRDGRSKDAFFLGILFSSSFFIKQSSIWFILFFLTFLIIGKHRSLKILQPFLIGMAIPLSVVVFFLVWSAQWNEFLFWGIRYPLTIIATMQAYHQLPSIRQILTLSLIFMPVIAIGLKWKKNELTQLTCLFFLGGILFSLHRFAYFHFQPAVPYLAIITAQGFEEIRKKNFPMFFAIFYILICFILLVNFVRRNLHQRVRFMEPNVTATVNQLKKELPEQTSVFVYNVPAQYFVLANLLPVKPWVDTFPWYLELPGMQKRVVRNLEDANVRYTLFSPFQKGDTYALGSYHPATIDKYVNENFQLQNKIDESLWILQRK